MLFPSGETVTRQRAASALDPYANESTGKSWENPDELAIPGCAFGPGASSEPVVDARTEVLTQPTLYAPFGSDITAADRLVIRGRTWQVDGDPADYRNPFTGWEAGMVVKLKAVSG